MKGRFWRKALAASLALLIVSGSVPIKPISNVFESMVVTAEAVEEVTKTFTISNAVGDPNNDSCGTITYDGYDFLIPDANMMQNQFSNNGITMRSKANNSGNEGTVKLYPHISGKVKSLTFSSARVMFTQLVGTEHYVKIGKGDIWTNSYTEDMNTATELTFTFTNGDGLQLANEDDYLEIKMRNSETTRRASFAISGTLTITYEPTASTLTHTHNFSCNATGNTLTATCAHDDGKECDLASSSYQISTSLIPPQNLIYHDGWNYPASMSGFANFKSETNATISSITYINTDTGENLGTTAPNSTGTYTASVTINVGGTGYTLTTSYCVTDYHFVYNNYPQFTTDKSGNYAGNGQTVTITFTPKCGETLTGLTVTGATTNYSLSSGITDNNDNTYTFTMPGEDVNIGATFSISEDDFAETGTNEYTIKTANGWDWFCFAVNYGLVPDGFSGKTVKLAADVESSEMAGTSNHPFKGTFDGQNHTLTFNRTAAEDFCAPFHYINGATISNLHVQGTITGGNYERLGGLVGHSEGNITIENCHVSTQISTTVSGVGFHGGVIAFWYDSNVACTVTGCVYDGLIYNPSEANATTYCSGFIGNLFGSNLTVTFTDCLYAPAAYGTGKYALGGNCFTFVYPNSDPTYNMTNCYYTRNLGNRQGRPAATATTKPANLGAETTNHGLVEGYENGFLYNGNYYTPKYGDAVVDYDFDEWNERASVTFNGDGYNLVGVNITENVEKVSSVTYNRTFTPGATTTVILPFNYDCNGNEGGKFYNFKDVTYDEDKHEWVCKIIAPGEAGSNNVTSLTANTPYLFVPTATKMTFPNIESMTGGVVTLQPTTLNEYGGATTNDNWNFYGTYTGKNWTETSKDYGFAARGGTAVHDEEVVAGQFVRYTINASIGPMRCYLRYAGNGALEDTYTVANPDEGDPVRNVPWWDGNDGYESTEIFDKVAHNINITAPTNGSVTATVGETANPATAFKGDTVNLTVTPDAGYTIKSVKYNGTNATKNADGTYSFTMPVGDVTVTAVFGHTVAIDNNITNGTVSADLPVAENNEAVTLTVTPAAGYAVKSVKVGNTEIEPVNGVYSFTMPDNDVTVTAEFEAIDYNINITAPTNGSITAKIGDTSASTAHYGDTVTLDVTPDTGYSVKSVKYNGTEATKNADGTYSFEMPAEEVTVTAEFKRVYSDGIGEHLAGHSLSLNGNIGVNFYMELDADVIADPDAYMLFTLPNDTTQTVKVSDATVDTTTVSGKTYYVFQCSVAAKEMTDTIKAQMFSGEKQGEEYSYTVKQYADYLFANAYEADGTTVKNQAYVDAIELIKSMVNYGAYSQLYFNHNTDSLANEDISDTNVSGVTAEIVNKTYDGSTNTLPDGVTLAGANLELESETVMNLYFTNTTGKALTFTTSGNVALVQEQSGEYTKVTITGIAAQYLDSDVTVNIALEGDDNAYSVKYSPMNYCYNVLARETTATRTEALKNVMRAFYLYNKEAKAYFASHNN